MKNFILKFKFFYRSYQKLIRKNQDEYKFIKYLFNQNVKVNILDLCCGDSFVLNYMAKAKDVFMSTSLFKSIKEKYPKYNLYVATKPENFSLLWANEFVHKTIPYSESFDNALTLEGIGESKEYFTMVFTPYLTTQKFSNYIHNMIDSIDTKSLFTC